MTADVLTGDGEKSVRNTAIVGQMGHVTLSQGNVTVDQGILDLLVLKYVLLARLVTTVYRNVLGVMTDSFVTILLDNAWLLPALLGLQGIPVKKFVLKVQLVLIV